MFYVARERQNCVRAKFIYANNDKCINFDETFIRKEPQIVLRTATTRERDSMRERGKEREREIKMKARR